MFGCPMLQETWKPQKEGGTGHSGLQLWLGLAKEAGQGQFTPEDWITRQGTLHFREAAGAVTLPPVNSGPEKRAQMSGIWELNLPSGCSLPS